MALWTDNWSDYKDLPQAAFPCDVIVVNIIIAELYMWDSIRTVSMSKFIIILNMKKIIFKQISLHICTIWSLLRPFHYQPGH